MISLVKTSVNAIVAPSRNQADFLREKMAQSKSYEEWKGWARELDRLNEANKWRQEATSKHYDYKLISSRLDHLKNLEIEEDTSSSMFFVRAGHLRNLGGMGNIELYQHSYIGTKQLIEDYVWEVVRSLNMIATSDNVKVSLEEKTAFFSELLQTFGRTVLILHGGASFGLCHLGVVKALHDQGMMPKIFCGSYVGALISALICTQEESKLKDILDGSNINFEAFMKKSDSNSSSLQRRLARLLKYGRLFDIRVLEQCARDNIGDITFKEAYEKSGLILNIVVYSRRPGEVPVLLNYLTAPELVVWSAACASLATPGMYENVGLLSRKEDGKLVPWHPSGIKLESARIVHELPLKRLTELFNANNFIVSHVPSYLTWRPSRSNDINDSIIYRIFAFFFRELFHRFSQLRELGLVPRIVTDILSFLSTPTVGDVQITPSVHSTDLQYVFASPNMEFLQYCLRKGQCAAWRKMTHIEMRCAIEYAIEDILDGLKGRKHSNKGRRRLRKLH